MTCHIKSICIFLLGMLCTSCVKQEKVILTQTFVLSNRTDQNWDMDIAVHWGSRGSELGKEVVNVTRSDSSTISIGKEKNDSVSMFFELNGHTSVGPLWMPLDYIDNYYMGHDNCCWVTTRLTNRETQQTYEWEQILMPYQSGTLPHDTIPYSWEWKSRGKDSSNTPNDRFYCEWNP